jgi:hypothetical protein
MIEQYNAALALSELIITSTVEFWTAFTFPALFYAKSL